MGVSQLEKTVELGEFGVEVRPLSFVCSLGDFHHFLCPCKKPYRCRGGILLEDFQPSAANPLHPGVARLRRQGVPLYEGVAH